MSKRKKILRLCPYCGSVCKVRDSAIVYDGRSYGPVLICTRFPECDSYVGCHYNGRPLGTPANAELREARKRVHKVFDPTWKNRSMKRSEAYRRLAGLLGISVNECHIAMFDVDMCERAIEVCRTQLPTSKTEGVEAR